MDLFHLVVIGEDHNRTYVFIALIPLDIPIIQRPLLFTVETVDIIVLSAESYTLLLARKGSTRKEPEAQSGNYCSKF